MRTASGPAVLLAFTEVQITSYKQGVNRLVLTEVQSHLAQTGVRKVIAGVIKKFSKQGFENGQWADRSLSSRTNRQWRHFVKKMEVKTRTELKVG